MGSVRYRKNINCLSADELHDFREALTEMYSLPESNYNSFEKIAGQHGSPAWHCIHSYPGFLTWHRAYMLAFEEALQAVNCDLMLPYWNWSSFATTGLPSAVSSSTYTNRSGATVANPLYRGPIPTSLVSSGWTARSSTVDTRNFGSIATSAQNASNSSTFSSFQMALNGPHGSVHGAVGGQMRSVPTAGFDPIFYLHHANVDRIWATWQSTHSEALSSQESNLALVPFTHAIGTHYKTGGEMFSTQDLGYRYSNWCFLFPVWPIQWPLKLFNFIPREPMQRVKLVFKSEQMPVETAELRVFVNENDASEDTSTHSPNFAGSIGFFGEGDMTMMANPRHGSRFDQSIEISSALEHCHHEKGDERPIDEDTAELSVVAVSPEGKRVDLKRLNITGLEIHVED